MQIFLITFFSRTYLTFFLYIFANDITYLKTLFIKTNVLTHPASLNIYFLLVYILRHAHNKSYARCEQLSGQWNQKIQTKQMFNVNTVFVFLSPEISEKNEGDNLGRRAARRICNMHVPPRRSYITLVKMDVYII